MKEQKSFPYLIYAAGNMRYLFPGFKKYSQTVIPPVP